MSKNVPPGVTQAEFHQSRCMNANGCYCDGWSKIPKFTCGTCYEYRYETERAPGTEKHARLCRYCAEPVESAA